MRRIVIALAASLLTLLALANVAAACGYFSYQPKAPAKLLK